MDADRHMRERDPAVAPPFGDLLRQHRRAAGLTQEELAERAGLSVRAITALERGVNRAPRRETLQLLGTALGLSSEERDLLEAVRVSGSMRLPFQGAARRLGGNMPPERVVEPERATELLTFLIAGIRGYTRYTEEQGDEVAARLATHFAELVEIVGHFGGEVVELRGDEVLATFTSARQALRAALQLRARFVEEIGTEQPVQVGIGLDAGDAVLVKGGYRTGALNLAASLQSFGQGEVFVSETVVRLTGRTEGISVIDRGEVAVKGRPYPERVYQIAAEGELPAELPPLQPLSVIPPTNLPDEATSFIGRENEIAAISEMLRQPGVRMVTLTGTGGTGKTRLAIQVASQRLYAFEDGVFFVSLASLSDPGLVASAIAETVGVTEREDISLLDAMKQHVQTRHVLLILDNFEHLLDAALVVAELLDACRALHVLVTSRIPLHLAREHEYAVPPLSVPDPEHVPALEEVSQYEAVALFIERAQAAKASFALTRETSPLVAEICCRLDGLPLAIELAAARIKLFPPQALLGRLSHRLALLTGGPRDRPARHQTLRAAIDWSHGLLSEGDRALFARLSAFAGNWTLEGAEAVCNAEGDLGIDILEGVDSLVEKSLLQQEGEEEPRFSMLETIREYAQEQLEARGEGAAFQRHHAAYYLSRAEAEAPSPELISPKQVQWLDRLEEEQDNLRAALRWSLQRSDVEVGLRLGVALHPFWERRGSVHEGRQWLRDLLALQPEEPTPLRAAAIHASARLAMVHGNFHEARQLTQEELELYRKLEDKSAMADTLVLLGEVVSHQGDTDHGRQFIEQGLDLARETENRQLVARCLAYLIWIAPDWMNDSSQAMPLAAEALALHRELEDRKGEAYVLHWLTFAAQLEGDVDRAQALFREGLAALRQLGSAADIRPELGWYALAARSWGDYAAAGALAEERLARSLALHDRRGRAGAYGLLALLAHEQGGYEHAEHLQEEALAICRELKDVDGVASALLGLGDVARAKGDPERIIACCTESLTLFQQVGGNINKVAFCLHNIGLASWYQGDYRRAEERIEKAISLGPAAHFLTSLGLVMLDQGRYSQARDLFAESLRKREIYSNVGTTATTLEGVAGVALGQGQPAQAETLFGAASALRSRCGTPIWPGIRPPYERHVESVRAALGEEGCQAAWEEGRAMPLEQAVTYALAEGTVPSTHG